MGTLRYRCSALLIGGTACVTAITAVAPTVSAAAYSSSRAPRNDFKIPPSSLRNSTAPTLTLTYRFVESSIPDGRDLEMTVKGNKVTVSVLAGDRVEKSVSATVPPKTLTAVTTSLKSLKSTKVTGLICPGSRQNKLKATFGKLKVQRDSATCSGDGSESVKAKGRADFDQTERFVKPLLDLVGDRDKLVGYGR
jgi:hypothetical protein